MNKWNLIVDFYDGDTVDYAEESKYDSFDKAMEAAAEIVATRYFVDRVTLTPMTD